MADQIPREGAERVDEGPCARLLVEVRSLREDVVSLRGQQPPPLVNDKFEKDQKQWRYEYLADQIKREDGLTNNRLTWILPINAFLFAALALITRDGDPDLQRFIRKWVPLSGMLINVMGFLALMGAFLALWSLKRLWRRENDKRWPQPHGSWFASGLGMLPNFIPLFLAYVWFVLSSVYSAPATLRYPTTPSLEQNALFNQILEKQETAWNLGDGAAWAREFADSADYVTLQGRVLGGRAKIERGLSDLLSNSLKGTTLHITLRKITMLSPRAAAAEADHVITNFRSLPVGIQATTKGVLRTSMHYVFVLNGGWKIDFAQNTPAVSDPP